jgi:Ca2+-binding EF-hand superfamily protein
MPILQINPLPNPIQRGINVDYFDRKALERQARHDKARALWAEETKAIANQRFDDVAAREQFLKERDAMFNNVVDKNAGNLSKGLHDVVGAVEKAQLHQYHNLNKKKMEELARQKALKDKYGIKYIDQSVGLDESLYDPEKGWLDPSAIKASGVEASDYEGTAKNLVDDLAAKIRAGSTDLKLSNDAYNLVTQYIQTKQLTPEMIRALADDPTVQQAFLMNAPTAGIDTREYQQGKTYQDIFSTPQGISDYIYGNARDKVLDQRTSKNQYIPNRAKLHQDALEMERIKQENKLKLAKAKANAEYALKYGYDRYETPSNTSYLAGTTEFTGNNVEHLYEIAANSKNLAETSRKSADALKKSKLVSYGITPEEYDNLSVIIDGKKNNVFKPDGTINIDNLKTYFAQNENLTEEELTKKINNFISDNADIVEAENFAFIERNEALKYQKLVNEWEAPYVEDAYKEAFKSFTALPKKDSGGSQFSSAINAGAALHKVEIEKFKSFNPTKEEIVKYKNMTEEEKYTYIAKKQNEMAMEQNNPSLAYTTSQEEMKNILDDFTSTVQNKINEKTTNSKQSIGFKDKAVINTKPGTPLNELSESLKETYNIQGGVQVLTDAETGSQIQDTERYKKMIKNMKPDTKYDYEIGFVDPLNESNYLGINTGNVYVTVKYTTKDETQKHQIFKIYDKNNQERINQGRMQDVRRALGNYTPGMQLTEEKDRAITELVNINYAGEIVPKINKIATLEPNQGVVSFTLPKTTDNPVQTSINVFKKGDNYVISSGNGTSMQTLPVAKGIGGVTKAVVNIYKNRIKNNKGLITELMNHTTIPKSHLVRNTIFVEQVK